jgi:cytochrome bd-type quinol oxidase subunit 1
MWLPFVLFAVVYAALGAITVTVLLRQIRGTATEHTS